MYYLLTWAVDAGPHNPADVLADVAHRMAQLPAQCVIIPGHTTIFEASGDDGDYEDILSDLNGIRAAWDGQLRFAFLRSDDRDFDGEGYDKAAAWQIIA